MITHAFNKLSTRSERDYDAANLLCRSQRMYELYSPAGLDFYSRRNKRLSQLREDFLVVRSRISSVGSLHLTPAELAVVSSPIFGEFLNGVSGEVPLFREVLTV